MRIVHFAPFAPNACGLYETTRDMIKAERAAGYTSELCDIGIGDKRRLGAVDERAGCRIVARDYGDIVDFDLFVGNGNIPPSLLSQTRAYVVHYLHGRPLSSFRLNQQQKDIAPVYDLHSGHVKNPRVRAMITLWPEHRPYWSVIVPDGKLRSIEYPPCDLDWYTPDGPRYQHKPEHLGKYNVLVADQWRLDVDPFDIVHGLIELAKQRHDFRVHFLACQTPLGPWEYLFRALRKLNALGEVAGLMLQMPERYRAADVVVTPHRIATRVVRESLACGCALVAHEKSPYSQFGCDPERPASVAYTVNEALLATAERSAATRAQARTTAALFSLEGFMRRAGPLYEEAIK